VLQTRRPEHYDVVVVGGGSAAFEAAVAARESGAERVLVLEKAPAKESGGNSLFSHTGFRFTYRDPEEIRLFVPELDEDVFRRMHLPPYTVDDFVRDLNRVTQGRINQELARVLAEESNDAVHWMRKLGMPWSLGHHVVVEGRLRFQPGLILHPLGGGPGQLRVWRKIAAERQIEVRYDAPVSAILGNMWKVEGVRISTPSGEDEIQADAVILCAGGFQANREMRVRYLGANADFMKMRGSRHNTGEVLRMALDLGARSSGHWQGAHMSPIDNSSPEYEPTLRSDNLGSLYIRYNYTYGITINSLGVRFFDEGEAQFSYTYAKTGKRVLEQPGGIAFQIFDQKGMRAMKPYAEQHLEQKIVAGSLEELAAALPVDREVFLKTIRDFNAAVHDDKPFDPGILDGRKTAGIDPPKSNWATAIDEPPFVAYTVTGGVTFTFGGVETTCDGQVVAVTGRPIDNLYAVGDIAGMFFHNYPACSGQTRNVVFARRAAQHACEGASKQPHSGSPVTSESSS
jgi:tricarballylate dehydrogenase